MPETVISGSTEELRANLKEYLWTRIQALCKCNGLVSIGVSGGSMPDHVVSVLLSMEGLDWKRVRIFLVDERLVAATDPDSNYAAYVNLLPEHLKQCVVPIDIYDNTSKTAHAYELTLKREVGPEMIGRLPRFDILLLGVGPDGHTCSIFPHSKTLKLESYSWVIGVDDSPKPPPQRITLPLSVVNNGKHVAFIITGESKAGIVKSILGGDESLPATLVRPFSGKLHLFLDKEAASKL